MLGWACYGLSLRNFAIWPRWLVWNLYFLRYLLMWKVRTWYRQRLWTGEGPWIFCNHDLVFISSLVTSSWSCITGYWFLSHFTILVWLTLHLWKSRWVENSKIPLILFHGSLTLRLKDDNYKVIQTIRKYKVIHWYCWTHDLGFC